MEPSERVDATKTVADLLRSAKLSLGEATVKSVRSARGLREAVSELGDDAVAGAKKAIAHIDANHAAIADHLDTAAKVSRVTAVIAAGGAAIAAPTGLAAVGVAAGVISAPLIVTAAPVLGGVAAGAAAVSAAASLYTKFRKRSASTGEA